MKPIGDVSLLGSRPGKSPGSATVIASGAACAIPLGTESEAASAAVPIALAMKWKDVMRASSLWDVIERMVTSRDIGAAREP